MEVPDKLILAMYVSSFTCNLVLVLQILLYHRVLLVMNSYWKKTQIAIRKLYVCLNLVLAGPYDSLTQRTCSFIIECPDIDARTVEN